MLSIRRSLFLVCMLLISGPLVLVVAWPQSRALDNEIHQARQYHLLVARTFARALERYHQDLLASFTPAVTALSDISAPRPEARRLRDLAIRQIALIDPVTGDVLSTVEGSRGSDTPRLDQQTLAELRAIASADTVNVTGVRRDIGGQPVLYLVRGVGANLAVAAIDTTYIRDLASSVHFGAGGHMIVVDTRGRVLAHPLESWEKAARDVGALLPVKRVLLGEAGTAEFQSAALDTAMIAGYAPVRGAGWGVIVPQPLDELREAASDVRQRMLTIFAIGLLLAALIAIRAGIIITAPLSRLTDGARRMTDGDMNVRVPLDSRFTPRELVVLTNSFNNMAERLSALSRHGNELRERAEKANASKSEFVRTVTHELRSPVNAILGFAELLSGRSAAKITPEVRDSYIRDIVAGSRHMLSLVNDLLDLARMESGQYELTEVEFWMDEITSRACRYVEPQAVERGVTIKVAFVDEPPLIVGDERALFQALLNLLTNAVRYGRRGGQVSIEVSPVTGGGIEMVVVDDGPGIAPEDLERVMLPFQRVCSKATAAITGTGLGLPIVKRFIELHGGSFTLTSELGHGTTARIALPASRVRPGGHEPLPAPLSPRLVRSVSQAA